VLQKDTNVGTGTLTNACPVASRIAPLVRPHWQRGCRLIAEMVTLVMRFSHVDIAKNGEVAAVAVGLQFAHADFAAIDRPFRSGLSSLTRIEIRATRALRNGTISIAGAVGMSKLQTDGDGGYLAVLCNIDVKRNRITSVTISAMSRQPRCQCGRTSGADATGNRTCIG